MMASGLTDKAARLYSMYEKRFGKKPKCIFCGQPTYGKTICDAAECEQKLRSHLPEPTSGKSA